ncbi:hypothetical protein RHMOL_Rhmol08G0328100 [Rhododendron molle]|uniref:Uncharacterized protein n=1 Tax=Rhododendron molle TaxID=49168 RepID=A0ACC0MV52_RHOML|nr:hypothetical protein RHMOL_Rhmol08G0328100 [Rhododendron molle]
MMTRDRSILEKNLLHLAVDFAEVNSAGGMTVLGVGDGDLRGSLWRGRGGVCRRCAMPMRTVYAKEFFVQSIDVSVCGKSQRTTNLPRTDSRRRNRRRS